MRHTNTLPRRAVLRLIWQFIRIAPFPLCVTLLLRLINAGNRGFSPIIIAGFTNALINAEGLFLWMGLYLVLMTLEILTDVFNGVTQMWFSNKAVLHFQQDLLRQAGQTPLLHFLDPDFHDNLSRATQGFSDRVVSWFRSVLDNVHSVASVCGLLGAVFIISSNIWCMIALFVSSFIILFTRKPIARLELERDRAAARPNRTQAAWAARLYERVNSPEVRLFTLQRWLLSKWEDAYHQLAAVEVGSLKRKTIWDAVANLSSIFGYCVIVFIAAQTARNGDPEKIAGVFMGLIAAAAGLQGFLSYMARSMGNLAEQSGVLRDLATLFTTQSAKESSVSRTTEEKQDGPAPASEAGEMAVSMNDLSFQYPSAATQTLKDITAKIAPGEIVALVGKNGAGKTTLANILLGLYAPDSGTLAFSQGAIASEKPTTSAVFQDFTKFLLPVRDNVGFADLNRVQDDSHMRRTLDRAGSTFAQELDTWLGHEFGGRDVSGGEWLRLAVARGLFRQSQFVVFDEPTAAIDPVAEVEMIQELLTKDASRTILVISHRLGVARLCDRILVLDEGQLVEDGTHEELLAMDGLYAEMWNAQASWYA
ncbi:MAG: ABC transporter ATP-binding protein [Candidatus Poribacteria bacterium]|nr:ABC transporter ATP-binding protein [Candidatus Poribacteria bacterium]